VQVEYKLVDVRTGEEVVTAIHRATTDLDKIAMAQVRVLTDLLKKAKATAPAAGSLPPASAPAAVPLAAPRSAQDGTERVSAARPMTAKEVQERLISLGYKPGVPDGVMGQRTVNALKAFQRDKGLPQTGTADEQTMLKLQAK
jgi:peptidoglycan hydrolase-like protein with peptidoglycan-binding domain